MIQNRSLVRCVCTRYVRGRSVIFVQSVEIPNEFTEPLQSNARSQLGTLVAKA